MLVSPTTMYARRSCYLIDFVRQLFVHACSDEFASLMSFTETRVETREASAVMTSPYVLYGTRLSGPTYKVALTLSLLGEKFDYVHVDLRSAAQKQPAYRQLNRFGQVPCLVDVASGLALCQSGSILQYLANKSGKLAGKTDEEGIRAREWIYWDFDRLVPNIYRPRAKKLGFRPAHKSTLAMYMDDGNMALKMLDDWLDGRHWLASEEPTIADVDVYGVVSYATEAGFDLGIYPNLFGWIGRFQALPGFRPAEDLLPPENRKAS
jgi:glutathione S-transferase